MLSDAMRIVFDTNVLVAGLRSRQGASRVLLEEVLKEKLTMLATPAIFMEYESVLTRPEHLQAIGGSQKDIVTILDALASVIEPVSVSYLWRPQLKDPSDEMVLEAAVNGHADWLLTFNLKHFGNVPSRFNMRLATPSAVLKHYRRNHEKK